MSSPDITRPARGYAYLVGAGPGDPGLITLRGVECLRRADVVIYDALVNPRLLEHCAPEAERISLGRHGTGRLVPQAEVNQMLVEKCLSGLRVVRLKGGDPAVFARITEELQVLAAAGIPVEIVPGITTALAAGSYAGVHLTSRDGAAAVALVTGHEREDKAVSSLDYPALARFPGTLVFYMGITTVEHWSGELLAAGKPAATPVAIVRRCSWPDQKVYRSTLGTITETLQQLRLRPPALVIVGEAAGGELEKSWFMQRPLFGKSVLVTRPRRQATSLRDLLEEQGALVHVQPAIEISPPENWAAVDAAIARLPEFAWVVFSSVNGVEQFMDRLLGGGGDARLLAGAQLAAIGPGTAARLKDYHLRADLIPDEYRAESLAAALTSVAAGSRCLLIRASRGREVLAEQLREAGASVEQVIAYRSTDIEAADPEVQRRLQAGEIDWITVTSSAIARSLVRLLGEQLRQAKLVSISPITTAVLQEQGYEVAAEADEYTIPGVVQAILRAEGA